MTQVEKIERKLESKGYRKDMGFEISENGQKAAEIWAEKLQNRGYKTEIAEGTWPYSNTIYVYAKL